MVPRPPVTPDEFFAVDPTHGTVHLLELPDAVEPGWSIA